MPLNEALRQLRAREDELARVQRIGQIGGLEVDLRGEHYRNERSPEYLALHGLPPSAANEPHEAWVARIHPQDRERVIAHFERTVLGTSVDYEVEYRIVRPSDGEVRWILAKAEIERDDQGRAVRLVGAHIDITARRSAEEQRELIARELEHRISNIFTIVTSIINMSARADPAAAPFAAELVGRIGALYRAHGLVLNKVDDALGDTLCGLLDRLVMPYRGNWPGRIAVSGDDIQIGRSSSTAVALIVHELATNAVKYGALSMPEGSITIEVESGPTDTRLRWTEAGGPAIEATPKRQGLGSILVDRAAKSQLGASMSFDWAPTGLSVAIDMQTARLAN